VVNIQRNLSWWHQKKNVKRSGIIEMNATPFKAVQGQTTIEETDTVFLLERMSTSLGATYTIQHVTSCEASCVSPYRMKKVRNHTIASRQKREMLDQNQNWILALSLNVVHRALNGQQEVLSLLVPYESEYAKSSCASTIHYFIVECMRC
jgi:hypothetical protein